MTRSVTEDTEMAPTVADADYEGGHIHLGS